MLNTFIPLNYLQRLGGWPEWFYYRIVVTFRAVTRGKYQQTILFDFKKVPKLVRHVLVEVGDFEDEPEPAGGIERLGSETGSPPAPAIIMPSPVAVQVQSPVLDSVTGEPVHIPEIEDCDLQNQEVAGMNRWNYSVIMGTSAPHFHSLPVSSIKNYRVSNSILYSYTCLSRKNTQTGNAL